jgi:lysyl-tRNA synthetase class 2
MISAMREFLDARGFLEVETPILQPLYGGANARPFTTIHNTYDQMLYLRISFELYLKRLVIGGLDRVYEIGRDFRNEGISKKHNPEFTMLEVYQAYADFEDMMELVEQLVAHAAERTLGTTVIEREGRKYDVAPPWPRRKMAELIRDACGIDILRVTELEALKGAVKQARVPNVDPAEATSWAGLVDAVFSETVEPKLQQPTFVVEYPAPLSPLAKRDAQAPQFVERFEAFIGGMEIANAFSELNDPDEQRARFEEQAEASRRGDVEAEPLDEDFLRALEHGMPPTGGLGVGVGRLAMILSGASHLREVKLFPHLRPRDA